MMIHSSKTFLLFLIVLLTTSQCSEDPQTAADKLPRPTHVGREIVACLVNGDPWISTGTNVGAQFYQGQLSIFANVYDFHGMQTHIDLDVWDLTEVTTKTYPLAKNFSSGGFADDLLDRVQYCHYLTGGSYTGSVTITHLGKQHGDFFIAGTFEFEAYSADCSKSVKITDGRFDLN
jgi:hypothetical protein